MIAHTRTNGVRTGRSAWKAIGSEAAERLNTTPEAVRQKAIRGRWQRTVENDGRARVRLPDGWPNPVRTGSVRRHAPVIVDTAGFRNRTAITALVATDLAIISIKPAIEDIEAAAAAYGLIQEINDTPERKGRPIRCVMVLTMTMSATVIARHARTQLTEAGYPLLKAEMANRVAYPEAGIEGLSPSIVAPDGPAARDIAAIARELMNLEFQDFSKRVATA